MASSAVPLMRLVDFALCTPEVGTINFSILHTALAVIIEQLGLNNLNIQFKGQDATKFENFKSFVGDSNIGKLPEFDITVPSVSEDRLLEGSKGAEETTQLTGQSSKEGAQSVSKEESIEVAEYADPVVESGELADRLSAVEKTVENLAVVVENFKSEFENVKLNAPGPEDNSALETKPSEDPTTQEGKNVRFQMDETSQPEEFLQLKTTIQQLSEKVETMTGPAYLQEAVKNTPGIQELISKANEIKKVLRLFSEADGQSESERHHNILYRLDALDTTVQTHDKQLSTVIEFIQKNPDALQLVKSEHRDILQAAGSKPSSEQSAHSMVRASITNIDSLHRIVTSNDEDIIYFTNKIRHFEEELTCLEKIVNEMLKGQEEKDMEYSSILEQIQVLRMNKADKHETEDILAGKADKFQVHTKVSHTAFDSFMDDVKTVRNSIINKLKIHEDTFKNEWYMLNTMMETKVNRNEMTPIVEYVNEHLKQLQEQVKALASLKKLEEAAGAKRKYLKDISCIACDTEVVMKQEIDSETKPPEHPVKPQTPSTPHNVPQKHTQQKVDEEGHAVKRYCGGSHTITTPKQRVTRVGHFLDQFGPVITALSKTGTPSPRN